MSVLTYRNMNGVTMQVAERETVKRRILEQAGWVVVAAEQPAAAPPVPQILPIPAQPYLPPYMAEDAAPETPGAAHTPLPADFPAVEALRRAGLLTVEDVRAEPDLTGIPGIGKATAARILAHPLVTGA